MHKLKKEDKKDVSKNEEINNRKYEKKRLVINKKE
jgi:hypothetical protein